MQKIDKCNKARINAEHCTCTYSSCPRHGLCCECLHYHRQRSEIPACYFTPEEERTYNRSIEFYCQRRS